MEEKYGKEGKKSEKDKDRLAGKLDNSKALVAALTKRPIRNLGQYLIGREEFYTLPAAPVKHAWLV